MARNWTIEEREAKIKEIAKEFTDKYKNDLFENEIDYLTALIENDLKFYITSEKRSFKGETPDGFGSGVSCEAGINQK